MKNLELRSDRLRLRPITLSDAEVVHQFLSIPEVDRYNTLGIPNALEETQEIIKEYIEDFNANPIRQYALVIEQLEGSRFTGLTGMKIKKEKYKSGEVWYKIDPKYWLKGFATEALRLLLDFGFNQLNLHRIEAGCAVENLASIRVLEKVGMTREGCRRKALPLKSGWSDNYDYGILKSDFNKKG